MGPGISHLITAYVSPTTNYVFISQWKMCYAFPVRRWLCVILIIRRSVCSGFFVGDGGYCVMPFIRCAQRRFAHVNYAIYFDAYYTHMGPAMK